MMVSPAPTPVETYTPELSVIVPTREESECVEALISRLEQALDGRPFEIIFVDDSDDQTPDVIRAAAETAAARIVCLHREPGERSGGLSGAVIAGLAVASGTVAVVMDGDLQHPPEVIPQMVTMVENGSADLVVASRYRNGGSADGLANGARRLVSRSITTGSKALFPRRLRNVSDPLSGFFAVRREYVELHRLNPLGYKILLEIVIRSDRLEVDEIGFSFGRRYGGSSKAGLVEGLKFFLHIARLRTGARAPSGNRQSSVQVVHA